jgi:hypothetical protein
MKNPSKLILDFINGNLSAWEWDDFISSKNKNISLCKLVEFCSNVQYIYPSEDCSKYCNLTGLSKLAEASQFFEEGDEAFLRWIAKFDADQSK